MRFIHSRLSAPVRVAVLGTAAAAVLAVFEGWASAALIEVFVVAVVAISLVWGAKLPGDVGAVIGSRADERQATIQLKVQALVGQVLSVAAAVALLIAIAVKAALWPFEILVGLIGVSVVAGWVIYRDHGDGRDE
jgi:hypothetical protein